MSYRRSRSSDNAWLWLIIGIVMGFGCSGVVGVFAIQGGYISVNAPATATQLAGNLQTTQPTVCGELDQLCEDQVAASPVGDADQTESPDTGPPPVAQDATEAPAGDAAPQETKSAAATATPAPPTASPTETNTPAPTATPEPTEPPIDPRLVNIRTELMPVAGGENIEMGTNQTEAALAVQECVNAGGTCTIAYAQDSFPVHTVKLSSFQMERYEVSVSQYVAFLNTLGPGSHADGCGGAPCASINENDGISPISFDGSTYKPIAPLMMDRPVTNVTWYGADAYCRAIGRRLPTEAEWERAARGTDPGSHIYPWGRTFDSTLANTTEAGIGGTTPVGSYPNGASPFGVEDMAGNVGEWVSDWYGEQYYSADAAQGLDPTGPPGGTEKVVRGGAWDQRAFFARAVHRLSKPPNEQAPDVGFRCVSEESPPPTAMPAEPSIPVDATPSETPTLDPNMSPTPKPTLPPGG